VEDEIMKKAVKSLLAIILVVVMTIGTVPLNGFLRLNLLSLTATAETVDESVGSYPLDVSISSNKTNYGALDKGTFTVVIKNVSNSTVSNISSKSYFKGLSPIGKNNTFNVEDVTLDAGESIEYSYNVTINPNRLNGFLGFFLKIKRLFSGSQSIPNVDYEDGRNKTSESITVKFSSVEITDTVTVWYKHDTEIINTTTQEEFSNNVMELVNESLNNENFNKESALEDEYYMCRVIANCSDYSMIDFSIFNADTIIMNDDGTVVLQFANRDLAEECSDYLNGLSSVTFAEADAYVATPEEVEIEGIPNLDNSIWGERYINADKYAHYLENNNFNNLITVAVVDTGVDMYHPYFNGRLTGGRNCFDGSGYPEDDTGHGTHVSGVVVNCTNNLNVKIMPIKSLNSAGGTLNSIVSGINYAISQRVQVINLSLESPYNSHSKYLENAINDAISKGIIVVVAAGNGEKVTHTPVNTANVSPANMENVIVVGALDETGTKGSFSNYGESVDVIAPGVAVPSTYLNGKYALMSGTSQAAPHIAAVVAMFKLAHPDYAPAQIETLVKQYCVDKGPEGRDDFYGDGCPDMYNAIPDCTVSFNSNGGSAVNSATTKNSSSVVLPTPSKSYKVTLNANGGELSTSYANSNCSFDGWYTTSSYTGTRYSGGESYMILKDQTLYAKWTNNSTNLTAYMPTKTGYNFMGWYTAISGGSEYGNSTVITKDITLYAHWEPVKSTITFNANGGSVGDKALADVTYESVLNLNSSFAPSRDYYDFLGWANTKSGTVAYRMGDTLSKITANKTLYAKWGYYGIPLRDNSQYGVMAKTFRPCVPDTNFDSNGKQMYCPVYEFSFYTGDTIPANGCIFQWYHTNGTYNGTTYPKQHQAFYFNSSKQLVYESQVTNTAFKNVFTYKFATNTFYKVRFEFIGDANMSTRKVKMSVYNEKGTQLFSDYSSGNTQFVQYHKDGKTILGASSSSRFTVSPNILLCGYSFSDAAYYDKSAATTYYTTAKSTIYDKGCSSVYWQDSKGATSWKGTSLSYVAIS
jgi:uncharacterized repeat protein (TIGR02543 family)